jgi:hypothetical protein
LEQHFVLRGSVRGLRTGVDHLTTVGHVGTVAEGGKAEAQGSCPVGHETHEFEGLEAWEDTIVVRVLNRSGDEWRFRCASLYHRPNPSRRDGAVCVRSENDVAIGGRDASSYHGGFVAPGAVC